MAVPRPLSRPPIREAIIDIRATVEREIPEATLRELATKIWPDVSRSVDQRQHSAVFRVEDGRIFPSTENADGVFTGVRLESPTNHTIAQLNRTGLVYSQLAPYRGGDTLVEEALGVWRIYAPAVGAVGVPRLGIRYINELYLPWNHGDPFARFLTGITDLPEGAPQSTIRAESKTVAQESLSEGVAVMIVSQKIGMQKVTNGPARPVVLIDIDAISKFDRTLDEGRLRTAIQELRELKNRAFFALLTDAALEQYQ